MLREIKNKKILKINWEHIFTRNAPLLMVDFHRQAFFYATHKWLSDAVLFIKYESDKQGNMRLHYEAGWRKRIKQQIIKTNNLERERIINDIFSCLDKARLNLIDTIQTNQKSAKVGIFIKKCTDQIIEYNAAYLIIFIYFNILYEVDKKLFLKYKKSIETARNARALFKDVEAFFVSFFKDNNYSNPDVVLWLLCDEVMRLLTGSIKLDIDMLTKRRSKYCMICSKHKIHHFEYGKNLELIGEATYKNGVVYGFVKKILSLEDLNKINHPDDIVVSYMTSTWHFPVLNKAKAILTEEGGILSHAAIISRELKIPCLINVKEIIKHTEDGDYVKIDTENETVEIF
ncbi:MAG: PEP-utilizing enzyme [Candidatus Magasanikbacteria bacterium]